MNEKAWIDVKSPRFFYLEGIQYIGVIVSGVKSVLSPTNRQKLESQKTCDIIHPSS